MIKAKGRGKRVIAIILIGIMLISLVGCNKEKKARIGVLVSDSSSAEALAFRSYYSQYIERQYDVEFMYTDITKDASEEKSTIDKLVANHCDAIISFSSFDRGAQIKQCSDAKVYYAIATGTLKEEDYNKYKGNEYYIGAIGPSLDLEYQTGYDMAKYYLDQGKTKFAIYGGAIPYYTEMHIYRAAGMLAAMCEVGGGEYKGAKDMGGIIKQIFQDGTIATGTIGKVEVMGYVGGYDMDEAWFGKCAQMSQIEGLEVILAVGNGSDFFGTSKGADVKIASVDAYASSFGDAMKAGKLDYLAGKFSASIGPIFIATLRAVNGKPVRDAEGNALALDQGYWIAKNYDEFEKYYQVDSSKEKPAYTKERLDKIKDTSYDEFKAFVEAYTFDEIQK